MPAARQAATSSPPRPSTYGSPPLSRTTPRAGLGVPDQQAVDLVLRHRVVAGGLADVDDDDVGGELVEHGAGAEPVDDDDVGQRQQRCARGW